MAAASVGSLIGVIRDWWLQVGVPKSYYQKASPAFKMLAKAPDTSWRGGTDGRPLLKFGAKSGLPGAGSSTVATSWANPTSSSNTAWECELSRHYQTMHIESDALEFGTDDGAYEDAKLVESESHVKRWINVVSSYYWGNGGGAIARLNGTGAAIAGTDIINLKNNRCGLRFEVNDSIQFAITDGTSGVVKTPVFQVIKKIGGDPYQLQLDRNILLADGILDNDFVFFNNCFGNVYQGVFSWLPTTGTQAQTTFFGVDRSLDTEALAGTRIRLTAGEDPWKVLTTLMRTAEDISADIDCAFVNTTFMENLLNAARPDSLRVIRGGAQMSGEYGGYDMSPVKDDPEKLRYGVDGYCVRWPAANKDLYVYADRYLVDIDSDSKQDSIVTGLSMSDWMLALSKQGLGWKDWDGNGAAYWIQGTENVGALYGAKGQVINRNTRNQIVLGTNVVP